MYVDICCFFVFSLSLVRSFILSFRVFYLKTSYTSLRVHHAGSTTASPRATISEAVREVMAEAFGEAYRDRNPKVTPATKPEFGDYQVCLHCRKSASIDRHADHADLDEIFASDATSSVTGTTGLEKPSSKNVLLSETICPVDYGSTSTYTTLSARPIFPVHNRGYSATRRWNWPSR